MDAVLFDLDSTIADTYHRQWMVPLILKGGEDAPTWDDYSMACPDDKPIEGTVALMRALGESYHIFIVTGRSSCARELTNEWLRKHHVTHDGLFMRAAGDRTPNGRYKVQMISRIIAEGYFPVLFVEDYPAAATEIEARTGIPVLLVNANYPASAPHSNENRGAL